MEPLDPHLFGAEQQCFGCGPHNERGMRLQFFRDGDAVVTRLEAQPGWEGAPGILHGGLLSTLLDEIGAWTVVASTGNFGFTTSMQLRFHRPARCGLPIDARGELVERTGSTARVQAILTQDGQKLVSGTATYHLPTREQAEAILDRPLPEAWVPLARPSQD